MSIHLDASTWRRRTAGGIPYKIIEGPTGNVSREEGASFTEVYIIRASDLLPFIYESFPLAEASGDNIVWAYPRLMPGCTNIYTRSISYTGLINDRPLDPFGADADAPEHYEQFLKVTIQYDLMKEPEDEGPMLEISARSSAEYLMLGADGNTRWQDGAVVRNINAPINQLVSETEWAVSFPKVPVNLIPTIFNRCRGFMGAVNSTVMSTLHDAPAESILFTGMSFQEQFSLGGAIDLRNTGQVSVTFLEKRIQAPDGPFGHNHFYRPEAGQYQRILRADGSSVYTQLDLEKMFA